MLSLTKNRKKLDVSVKILKPSSAEKNIEKRRPDVNEVVLKKARFHYGLAKILYMSGMCIYVIID